MKTLIKSWRRLYELIIEQESDIEKIDASFNNITVFSIPKDLLYLKVLILNDNNLKNFDLDKLPDSLQELYLNNNNLHTLKGLCPRNLKILDLSNNRLNKISSSKFKKSKKLSFINLQNNRIDEWCWDKNILNNLESFLICHNKIRNFSWFNSPNSLKTVDLSFNKLNDFSFKGMPSLKILCIQDIHLVLDEFDWNDIPSSLEVLDINNNDITSFNWDNCKCKNIKEIYMVSSKIKSFSWKNCPKKLKKIYCDYNYFKFDWDGCPDLEYIIFDADGMFSDTTLLSSPDSLISIHCNRSFSDQSIIRKNIPRNLKYLRIGEFKYDFDKTSKTHIKEQARKKSLISDSIISANLLYSDIPVLNKYACREYFKIKNYFYNINIDGVGHQ